MNVPSWTPGQDSQVILLRQAGESWGTVARMLGMSRDAVLARGRRLGLQRPRAEVVLAQAVAKLAHDDADLLDRDPYPAGHPVPWGLINAGLLLLENAAYAR